MLAIGGVGFALVVSAAGGLRSGADTPEAAVTELAAAISDGKVVPAIRLVAPGEIRGAEAAWERLRKVAADDGLIDPDNPLAGLDLKITGLDTEVEEISADLAKVSIREGRMEASFDPANLHPDLREILDPVDPTAESAVVTADDLTFDTFDPRRRVSSSVDPFLMVVRAEDRWYVSPLSTALEYASIEAALPAQASGRRTLPADRPDRSGAPDPEAAVRQMVEAAFDLDTRGVLGLLPAGEAGPLDTYRDLVDAGLSALEEEIQQAGFRIALDDLQTEVKRSGSEAVVTVTSASGTFSYRDCDGCAPNPGRWRLDGDCLDVSSRDLRFDQCLSDLGASAGVILAAKPVLEFLAVEEDGQWFVSLIGTIFNGTAPPSDLRSLLSSVVGRSGDFSGSQGSNQRDRCLISLRTLRTAAEAYFAQNGRYPRTQEELVQAGYLSQRLDGVELNGSAQGFAEVEYTRQCARFATQ
ncbi:MAG: hypothetical protein ACT4OS_04870 [Acidimicrobiales bacterium]